MIIGSKHFYYENLPSTNSYAASLLKDKNMPEGCIIYTTAEIVIQSTDQLVFKREKDGSTPWEELQVEKRKIQ